MKIHAPVLQATNLNFRWPGSDLFHDLNLCIPPGVSLLSGDEGSGKTTLLRLLAGDIGPQSGQISLNGMDSQDDRVPYQQQVFRTDPRTETLDQLSAAVWLQTLPNTYPRFSSEAVMDLVQGFDLTPHLDKPMYMLSAGSKRKVWLTGAMASCAPLTLLDQPFAALDTPSMRFLIELLQEASRHPTRAWLVADYEAPAGVSLATTISL